MVYHGAYIAIRNLSLLGKTAAGAGQAEPGSKETAASAHSRSCQEARIRLSLAGADFQASHRAERLRESKGR
jgi:hypothetical protein